jgi:hypothetical protein
MTDAVWSEFCRVPEKANERLTAILEFLVKNGEANLPGRCFRWVRKTAEVGSQLAEIEAKGVVLGGHVCPIDGRQQLFVTQIIVDEVEEVTPPKRKRKTSDERQGKFKFDASAKGHSRSEGEPK